MHRVKTNDMAHYISSVLYIFFLLYLSKLHPSYAAGENSGTSLVHIGAVLDKNSSLGSMADMCIRMAVSDYYSVNPNHTTRLKIHVKNAANMLDANLAVLDLLNHDDVVAIVGPHDETENVFITELGDKVLVPIISYAAKSSFASHSQNRFFLRATSDDALQAKAIAAVCQGFSWPAVVVLYEDTDYGNQFLSHLNKAFQEVDIGLDRMTSIATLVEDSDLLKELEMLRERQTRVFVVHMSPLLGNRLFTLAKRLGIMSEGYAWIISDSISNFMSSMDLDTRDSMEGVLGIRPYVNHSKELQSFQQRWKRNMLLEKNNDHMPELNIYGLWAYDAITALAMSVANIGPVNSTSSNVKPSKNKTGITNLRVSEVGPRLLDELSRTRFRGLAGDFQLVDGKLKQSTFEIFNVYGTGEKTIGFWTPDEGIIGELSSIGQRTYSTSIGELKNVVWPGDSVTRPKGWAIPTTGRLRVGVPWKKGFVEFGRAIIDPETNHTIASGFAVDIFLASLKVLPFPISYEFQMDNNSMNADWSYDEMLHKIPQNFDMVVADTTIRASRTKYVEFSLPYAASGVTLVVKNKKPFDMWIFTRPLRWDLWLAIFVACIFMGIVLRIIERQETTNNEDNIDQVHQAHEAENGDGTGNDKAQMTPAQQVDGQVISNDNNINTSPARIGLIHWSPFAVLAFPESNMVSNKWSISVLVVWMFMGFILMQSYTASLSSIFTLDQLDFSFSDNYYVGYQGGSFMEQFLTEQLHISESRLRSYSSPEDYHNAMSLGSKKGGIDAIFDEIPYMTLMLKKYDSQYKMVGPTYKTGGFSFAFPVGSPLVPHFSKATVNVTQGPEITAIEQKNFGPGYSSQDPLSSTITQGKSSLTLFEFGGLFIVVGVYAVLALFFSSTLIGRKLTNIAVLIGRRLTEIVEHFIRNFRSKFSRQRVSRANGTPTGTDRDGPVPGDCQGGTAPENGTMTINESNANDTHPEDVDEPVHEDNHHNNNEIQEIEPVEPPGLHPRG